MFIVTFKSELPIGVTAYQADFKGLKVVNLTLQNPYTLTGFYPSKLTMCIISLSRYLRVQLQFFLGTVSKKQRNPSRIKLKPLFLLPCRSLSNSKRMAGSKPPGRHETISIIQMKF